VPERISWAVEQLDVQPTDRLLEIGSGRGVAVELICRQLDGGHVLAIDRSAKATDAAAQRNARYAAAGSASFEEISLEDADLGEARFDKVFTINVNRLFTVEGVVAGWMVAGALVPHPAGDDPPVPVHRVGMCGARTPAARPSRGPRTDGQVDRVAQRRRSQAAGRDRQARPHPEQASR
jgi:hypothetical protein